MEAFIYIGCLFGIGFVGVIFFIIKDHTDKIVAIEINQERNDERISTLNRLIDFQEYGVFGWPLLETPTAKQRIKAMEQYLSITYKKQPEQKENWVAEKKPRKEKSGKKNK